MQLHIEINHNENFSEYVTRLSLLLKVITVNCLS
jgi:hypothetical protein